MKFIGDLKKGYYLIFESDLILALLLVLSAFKFPTNNNDQLRFPADFDAVQLVDIPITKANKTPHAPPKPRV